MPELMLFYAATAPAIRSSARSSPRSRRPAARRSRRVRDILPKLSGKDNPQAVLGVYRRIRVAAGPARSHQRRISGSSREALRDPGNLGTILRTGDAVGAGGLILIGECVDPFSVEAVRAEHGRAVHHPDRAGALGRVPPLASLRARANWSGPASTPTRIIASASYPSPTFLLIGNEAQGLPADYAAECDLLVKIPMLGKRRQSECSRSDGGDGL